MTGSPEERVLLEAAYVLHQRPYRDTSRIVELLCRDHGRYTVFSRGTRKAGSRLGAVLQPFSRILVSWTARGEAGTLTHAEFASGPAGLGAERLMSGFYLNELLIRLLPRRDPHVEVFELYESTLAALRVGVDEAAALRIFEKRLLESVGYGLPLTHDARSGEPVDSARSYRFVPDEGPIETTPGVAEGHCLVSGATLVALAAERLDEPVARREARAILRLAIERCLEGRGLRSRDVLMSMRRSAPSASGRPVPPAAGDET